MGIVIKLNLKIGSGLLSAMNRVLRFESGQVY